MEKPNGKIETNQNVKKSPFKNLFNKSLDIGFNCIVGSTVVASVGISSLNIKNIYFSEPSGDWQSRMEEIMTGVDFEPIKMTFESGTECSGTVFRNKLGKLRVLTVAHCFGNDQYVTKELNKSPNNGEVSNSIVVIPANDNFRISKDAAVVYDFGILDRLGVSFQRPIPVKNEDTVLTLKKFRVCDPNNLEGKYYLNARTTSGKSDTIGGFVMEGNSGGLIISLY